MIGADPAYYDRVRRFSATGKYAAETAALLGALAIPAGARVLDLGCGTGALLERLRALGFAAVGIDAHDFLASHVETRPVVRADGRRLPFREGSFHAATLMHALAHIDEPRAALAEIRRVLRPGGRLGIVTPNRRFLAAMSRLPRWFNGYAPDPTVVAHVDVETLALGLEGAGFTLRETRTFGPRAWPWPTEASRERLLAVAEKSR